MASATSFRVRRPFSGIHWIVPVCLLLLWEYSWYARQCIEGPRYFEVVLATVTICVALWANQSRVGRLQDIGKVPAILGGALLDLVVLSLAVILISIPAPAIDCGSPAKIWVSKMYSVTDDVRTTIKTRINQKHSLTGVGIGLDSALTQASNSGLIAFGHVTPDGTILVASDEPRAALILRPSIAGATITWTCLGIPAKFQPRHCP